RAGADGPLPFKRQTAPLGGTVSRRVQRGRLYPQITGRETAGRSCPVSVIAGRRRSRRPAMARSARLAPEPPQEASRQACPWLVLLHAAACPDRASSIPPTRLPGWHRGG